MKLFPCALAALLSTSALASANDTTAVLKNGGLVFVTNEAIEMASEDLSISTERVKVVYEFKNIKPEPQKVFFAFPMPDIEGSLDFMTGVPTDDPANIFGFETTFRSKPVRAELHQSAFFNNIDFGPELKKLGVPLAPFGDVTSEALGKLSDADRQHLIEIGVLGKQEYDAGNGPEYDYYPLWTLRSAYSWEETFAPGETVEVVHTYKPSVGGTVAPIFAPMHGMTPGEAATPSEYLPEYTAKYCLDDSLLKTVEKSYIDEPDYQAYPWTESWISYVLTTGANWSGPIGDFTLTVDKGDPKNLVSFCGENVEKIGPTTFRMKAKDFSPDKDLDILILNRNDPEPAPAP